MDILRATGEDYFLKTKIAFLGAFREKYQRTIPETYKEEKRNEGREKKEERVI